MLHDSFMTIRVVHVVCLSVDTRGSKEHYEPKGFALLTEALRYKPTHTPKNKKNACIP